VAASVKVEDFPQHVMNMHMHSDIAFSEEYEKIGVESKKYVSAASINPTNEAKNRYGNIYAC
jgi:predicted transcriptional regulator YdeE